MRLVVDASALVALLLRGPAAPQLGPILGEPSAELHIPFLCEVEIGSALRGLLLAGRMGEGRAAEAMASFLDLPLTRHGHEQLLGRILELRENFSPYEAIYVALAEKLEATLLTTDARLARAVRRQHLKLDLLP